MPMTQNLFLPPTCPTCGDELLTCSGSTDVFGQIPVTCGALYCPEHGPVTDTGKCALQIPDCPALDDTRF